MLYKYLSPSRLSVIDNFMIRFTQPSQLNDPFESMVLVDPEADGKVATTVKELQEFAAKQGLLPQNAEDQKELDAAIADVAAYAAKELSPHSVGRNLMERINKAQGVLSLSRANDSLLMWAHYADSHRGYVIGLDESHPFFRQVDPFGNPTKTHNVVYTSRRVPVKATSDGFYEKLLCVKSLEWAYEEEVRIFRKFGRTFDEFEKNLHDQIHLFSIPPECIKEIYIGANASAATHKEIRETIDRRKLSINLFEAYIAEDRYALGFREITQSLYSYRPKDFHALRKTKIETFDFEYSYENFPVLQSHFYAMKIKRNQ